MDRIAQESTFYRLISASGINGSGKSNLIEVIDFIRSTREGQTADLIRRTGGVREWSWKGATGANPSVEVSVAGTPWIGLTHRIEFDGQLSHYQQTFEEIIRYDSEGEKPNLIYQFTPANSVIYKRDEPAGLGRRSADTSVLHSDS